MGVLREFSAGVLVAQHGSHLHPQGHDVLLPRCDSSIHLDATIDAYRAYRHALAIIVTRVWDGMG